MSLSNHVDLSITQDSVSVPRAGFGTGLILSYSADWVERVRVYNRLADVEADFSVTTSPEYLAAQAYFSQQPRPKKLKIGRGALPATKTFTIVPTAVHSAVYEIAVSGEGFPTETISYTADSATTVAEICTGLEAALNAVTSKNFTASDDITEVTVDGDAAGDWFALEVLNHELLGIVEDHVDPGVATDLTAIQNEDSDWYGLLTNFNSDACVKAADAWAQTRKKLYAYDVCETEAISTSAGNGDTLDDVKDLERARTMQAWHPRAVQMPSAAWMGKKFPSDAGSTTWKFAKLTGVTSTNLTATQRANLIARNANFYETVAQVAIMVEGTTADGEFIDTQRGLDWLDDEMSKEIFENLIAGSQTGKIPYTDAGKQVIIGAIEAVLQRGVNRGFLVAGTLVVTAPDVADISNANKLARTFPDIEFSATLAGAIHKVTVTGVVSV